MRHLFSFGGVVALLLILLFLSGVENFALRVMCMYQHGKSEFAQNGVYKECHYDVAQTR